jgi:hypothetical protein
MFIDSRYSISPGTVYVRRANDNEILFRNPFIPEPVSHSLSWSIEQQFIADPPPILKDSKSTEGLFRVFVPFVVPTCFSFLQRVPTFYELILLVQSKVIL